MDNLINIFEKELECDYRGEHYSVRDNGAVMRHPKDSQRPRLLDNTWTFGKKDSKTGYMFIGSARVHQVVATAFWGQPEDKTMVVDHIDTNRCNNRAENLRWFTRLENTLNNSITRKRVILCCGSLEAFLENPSLLRENAADPNTKWMRTVSSEEAEKCRKHLERWALEDSKPAGNGLEDRIFKDNPKSASKNDFDESWDKGWESRNFVSPWQKEKEEREKAIAAECERLYEEWYGLKDSLTPGAKQKNWKTPAEFPLCPSKPDMNNPLEAYLKNLEKGKVFVQTNYYKSLVYLAEISNDRKILAVITSNHDTDGIKPFALALISYEDGYYVHTNDQTYFDEEGAIKYYTIALGREWTGGDVFDDYC